MRQARAVRTFLPALFFLAWAVIFTFPLVLHLGDSVVLTGGGDAWLHLWDLWWADKSIIALHQNPYFTNYLYYPTGLNLFYHSLDILNGVVSIPLQHIVSLTTSFNLLVLVNLTLDGCIAYWLCLERAGSIAGALVGGALFASAPLLGTSVNLGQLDEITAWWLPLFVLALWRALDSPQDLWKPGGGRRAILCAGLCLVGASLATWYFTAGLFVFILLFVPAYLLTRRGNLPSENSRNIWLRLAVKVAAMGAIAVLLLSPLLWAMIQERLSGATYMLPSFATTLANSADLAGLFLPGRTEVRTISEHGSNVALGLVALALSMVGLARKWRVTWPLGLALVGIAMLSLGPHLQLFGTDTNIPMPYALLDRVPFIGASRQPLRFLATAGICLSLLAAYGVSSLEDALRNRQWRAYLAPALLLLTALELFGIPRAMTSTAIGPAYAFIRDAKEPGAVMELPYELWQTRPQLHQSLHERPILGGYTSRHFPYPFIEAVPGASQLAVGYPETLDAPDIITPTIAGTALASLDYYSVRYVVVHKDDLATGRFGRLSSLIEILYPAGPVYDDASVSVYETPHGPAAIGIANRLPLVGLGRGWHEVEENPTRRWTGSDPGNGDAYVWIGVRPGTEGPFKLTMQLFSYGMPRHLSLMLDSRTLLTKEIGLAPETVTVDLGNLVAGDHGLVLKVEEPPTNPPGDRRLLSLGATSLQVSPIP